MSVALSLLHWGLLFGVFQFPERRVRVLLIGPLEFAWPQPEVPGPAAKRLLWLWSPSRVFQLLIGDSKGTMAFGFSLELGHEGKLGGSLRLQLPRFSIMFNWLPAHHELDRSTMSEWARKERANKQITQLLERVFGKDGSGLEGLLKDMQAPQVDLTGKSNLN